MSAKTIAAAIRDVPDFPKPGIVFKDISPILQDPKLFRETIDLMVKPYLKNKPDVLVAIDARGFVFGSAMAYAMGTGITMLRKKGKLPWKARSLKYDLEYGSNEIEIHEDAVAPGNKVLIVDDVLATGGTAEAAVLLVESIGGKVLACSFLMELKFLNGRSKLTCPVNSLIDIG